MLIKKEAASRRDDKPPDFINDFELYNLSTDIAEKTNLAAQQSARVKAMAARLQQIHEQGHSRAGYNAASNKH